MGRIVNYTLCVMMFLFGMIFGWTIGILFILINLWLTKKKCVELPEYLGKKITPRSWKPHGSITMPSTDLEEAREKILQENSSQGKATKLEELI
ncbi:MAG: hypothetical protein HYZ54_13690 [Ignavibacteriae bacterium]|nr:hypothetical protein [Ignavibacteriota bacterium]